MVDFIEEHRDEHGVEPICRVLPIAPSTYYEHRAKRLEPELRSARAKRDEELLERLLEQQTHMALVIDDHGTATGLVTLEDVVETLFGAEIVDEADNVADLRELARKRWQERAQRLGMLDDATASE